MSLPATPSPRPVAASPEPGSPVVSLARALAIGAVAGLLVGWFAGRVYGFEATPARLLDHMLKGTLYGLALSATEHVLGSWLRAIVPLRSGRAVAIHVAAQVTAALAAFSAVTLILVRVAGIELPFAVLAFIALLAVSITAVSNSVHSLAALHQRIQESERSAAEAELRALRAQINPHFLFNSLNSIASLIRTRPPEAEAVTENLADLFRYSLRASTLPTVSLADEVESVEIYLAIEQARFRERLAISIVVPEELLRAQVPSLVLQPLVENAVKHGVQQTLDCCRVELRAERDGEHVRVEVSDTGPGFASTDLETALDGGTGLRNVRGRLRHAFGETAALRILPRGVEIRFPLQPAGDKAGTGGASAAPFGITKGPRAPGR